MSTTTAPTASEPFVPLPPRLTAEEFLDRYNGGPYELVKGVLKEVPMAGLEHGMVCMKIGATIFNHVAANGLGRVMSNDSFVRTGPDTIRGADVLFYSYERLPKEQPVPRGIHTIAPDLVVEIKSPTDLWVDVFTKVVEYLRAGVRVVVLLDPIKLTVSLYRDDEQTILGTGDTLTLPDVLPGFTVPVSQLFA